MSKKLKMWAVIWCAGFMVVGCSAHKHSEQQVSTNAHQERVQKNSEDRGVASSMVGFVGDVVALPFRLVGGIIDFIF